VKHFLVPLHHIFPLPFLTPPSDSEPARLPRCIRETLAEAVRSGFLFGFLSKVPEVIAELFGRPLPVYSILLAFACAASGLVLSQHPDVYTPFDKRHHLLPWSPQHRQGWRLPSPAFVVEVLRSISASARPAKCDFAKADSASNGRYFFTLFYPPLFQPLELPTEQSSRSRPAEHLT